MIDRLVEVVNAYLAAKQQAERDPTSPQARQRLAEARLALHQVLESYVDDGSSQRVERAGDDVNPVALPLARGATCGRNGRIRPPLLSPSTPSRSP